MDYDKVIKALLSNNAYKATLYISPKQIIRAVRKRYKLGGKELKIRKIGNIEITLSIGRPNYQEREFIKKCIKAGEPFPVRKIQVKLQK